MDLRFSSAEATDAERAALDFVDAPRRDLLLPALHAVADAVGWLSEGAINEIGRRLDVAPAEVYGVASFYAAFSFVPRPPRTLRVCTDLACLLAGARPPAAGEIAAPCLGLCDRAPARLELDGSGAPAGAEGPDLGSLRGRVGRAGVLLRRVGVVDPASIEAYLAHGGYRALRRAFALGPHEVIAELSASGLVGRGGAAFPTGRKWEAVAAQPAQPHYLVANADESEPGTFKDGLLLEGDPFALVEAMTVAAFATGCEQGFVYLRHEYPHAAAALRTAIDAARGAGWLGDDVMGTGMRFDIEVRRGAGAYICGEETAIFNSIEGHRGEPRNKPPFPAEAGLFGKPTVVNNVETLVNVLPILTGELAGTRLFSVCGQVARPGVYELQDGVPLRRLLADAGAGDPRAVLLGGAAGMFAGPDDLDMPLSMDGARAAGLTLGSGVVMVIGADADLDALVARLAAFFRDESCGQCVPCRVGTVRQEEIVRRLQHSSEPSDVALLLDVGRAMRDASICGLGQTASSAIESAITRLGLYR